MLRARIVRETELSLLISHEKDPAIKCTDGHWIPKRLMSCPPVIYPDLPNRPVVQFLLPLWKIQEAGLRDFVPMRTAV